MADSPRRSVREEGFGVNGIMPPAPALSGPSLMVEGIRWTLSAEGDRQLRARELTLAHLVDESRATRVKHGPHRSVFRVELESVTVYLKQSKIWTVRSFLRECLRGPKSKLEFDRANLLLMRGVPTAVPLAWGIRDSWRPGETYLITRELPRTEQLNHFLERSFAGKGATGSQVLRSRIAEALGKFIARVHAAGITHTDLHPGNLLMHLNADRVEFFLLDLHDLGIGQPLSWRKARENLAVFNRWFLMRASRSDRLRFWHAYSTARDLPFRDAVRVEAETWKSNHRFWRSRDARCLKNNRYFRKVSGRAGQGFAVKEIDSQFLSSLLKNPDAPFEDPSNRKRKDSRSSTVVELNMPTANGTVAMIFKRFRVTSWQDGVANMLRQSPAIRSWQRGHGMIDRGLPTARPWLVLHRRRWGLSWEGYLLCERIANAKELQDEMRALGSNRPARRLLLEKVARLIRRMHETGLSHRDLKAANLLVTPDGEIHFVDLVGVRANGFISRKVRVQNLTRLNASFLADGVISRTERLRFLLLYLNTGLHSGSNWRRWWHEIERATREKIERNRKRGRPLA